MAPREIDGVAEVEFHSLQLRTEIVCGQERCGDGAGLDLRDSDEEV